jgi:hypothetical protein
VDARGREDRKLENRKDKRKEKITQRGRVRRGAQRKTGKEEPTT